MTKLGDKLRELAATADRDGLTGIAFVQVDDWSRQVTSAGRSADPERDAKALVTSLYQAARAYATKSSAPAAAATPKNTTSLNWRDRIRPRFAEMCALKNWKVPLAELRVDFYTDNILIGDKLLVMRKELDDSIPTSEIYARMEKICAERVEQSA